MQAINGQPVAGFRYGPDPRGASWVYNLAARIQTVMNGADGVIAVGGPSSGAALRAFHGYTLDSPQKFTGQAGRQIMGSGTVRAGQTRQLTSMALQQNQQIQAFFDKWAGQ